MNLQNSNLFDELMTSYWERWAEAPVKKKELYYRAIDKFPWPCVEVALGNIKTEENFDRVPTVQRVQAAASSLYQTWRERQNHMRFLSPDRRNWQRLADVCATVEDKEGKTWTFTAQALVRESDRSCALLSGLSEGKIREIVLRAKQQRGGAIPEVVWIAPGSEESKGFTKQLRSLVAAWGRAPAKKQTTHNETAVPESAVPAIAIQHPIPPPPAPPPAASLREENPLLDW